VYNHRELYFCAHIKNFTLLLQSSDLSKINKSTQMMILKHLKFIALSLLISSYAVAIRAEVSPDAGKELYKNYCAACHTKDMRTAATGPALGGSQERWGDDEALYAWIRNSQALIAKGHPRAVELWNQYKPTIMTAFPNLTDDEIGSIMAYINGVYDGSYGAKPGAQVTAASGSGPQKKQTAAVRSCGGDSRYCSLCY
jgi:mono/diheme cytochrome c family protein